MVKVPAAGRVKTRLVRGIGLGPATNFYRHAVASLVGRLTRPSRWTVLLAVSPDAARKTPALPGPLQARVPQGRGDLGQRMQRVIDGAPTGPVIVIGTDVPGITERDIARAFHRLAGHDAVIGPSPDGGYWLIGLGRRRHRLRPFRKVPWSTSAAFTATMRNLAGSRVALIDEKADIDDDADWSRAGPARSHRIVAPLTSRELSRRLA
jgi:rSAM/selenodomain-associated transferase 1